MMNKINIICVILGFLATVSFFTSCGSTRRQLHTTPDEVFLVQEVNIYKEINKKGSTRCQNYLMFYGDRSGFIYYSENGNFYIIGKSLGVRDPEQPYYATSRYILLPYYSYSIENNNQRLIELSKIDTLHSHYPLKIGRLLFPIVWERKKHYGVATSPDNEKIEFKYLKQLTLPVSYLYDSYPEIIENNYYLEHFNENFNRECHEEKLEDSIHNELRKIFE